MGTIRATLEDVPTVISALEDLKSRLIDATRDATSAAGSELQHKARANFIGIHARGEWHMGGGAGSRPNVVSGALQASIVKWPIVAETPYRFMVQINPTLVYSRALELGAHITPHGNWLSWVGRREDGTWGRILRRSVTVMPHPYLRPATEDMIGATNPIFYNYILVAWHA